MEKQYFTVKQLDKVSKGADYVFLYSTRSDGKSYAVKSRCLLDAYQSIDANGICRCQLAYMKRYDMDNKDRNITPYFADMPVQEITDGKYSHIVSYRKEIFFAHMEKGKIVRDVKIGNGFSISGAEHDKSLMFPEIRNVIFEEVTTMSGQYLFNEPTLFQHAVSTIIRDREAKVYLIGNKISRMCPYFEEWQLHAEKVKAGEKNIITFHDEQTDAKTTVVFYHVLPSGDSRMFFGRAKDNITKGEYYTDLHQHLKKPHTSYSTLHTVVLEYDSFMYLMRLIFYRDYEFDNDYAWYIEPKTTPVQAGTRLITNQINRGGKLVTDSIKPLTDREKIAFDYLFDKTKVFFSDNLTGTEFYNILSNYT